MQKNSVLLTPTTTAETARHTAAPTGSITLNHVRGPGALEELEAMRAKRADLVAKLQKISREIADAELLQLVSAA